MTNIPVTMGTQSQQEPSITVNTLNNLTVIVTSSSISTGTSRINVYVSQDGGFTYPTSPTLTLPVGFTTQGNAIGTYGYRNTFMIACTALNTNPVMDSSITVYTSTDNGVIFSAPVITCEGFGQQIYNDKPFIQLDNSNGSPYLGLAHVGFTRYYDNFATSGTFYQRSLDLGQTWSIPILLSDQTTGTAVFGTNVAIGPTGQVYVAWAQYAPGNPQFLIRRSDDGGATFNPIVVVSNISLVPSPLPVPGFAFRVLTSAFLAVDISANLGQGILYAVWQGYQTGFSHIYLSRSTDQGNTWSTPIQVDDSPTGTQNFYPNIAVSRSTGLIQIVYYTNRVDSSMLDVYGTTSGDAGATFAVNTRLSDTSFDPNADPSYGEPCPSLGDYIDVAFTYPDRQITVWTGMINNIQNIISNL
ncbi:sialidase family protein [Paenibacillus sp. FSL A5-0031]|uniref:sialidase family protein n=1 Tax=Paenibacillus sp. FSL A5-0031 TaxID=1920420 RepID=UPI0009FB7413|nr:sialidase family protein [Paenibacillus sp. FSL A5-0031]